MTPMICAVLWTVTFNGGVTSSTTMTGNTSTETIGPAPGPGYVAVVFASIRISGERP
jgi:hypothetical protein